jgi:hypothetical protein
MPYKTPRLSCMRHKTASGDRTLVTIVCAEDPIHLFATHPSNFFPPYRLDPLHSPAQSRIATAG